MVPKARYQILVRSTLVFEDERTTSILMRHVMSFIGGALRRMVDTEHARPSYVDIC